MLFSSIVKMFKKGNVCVTGLRGTGKDLLMGNVIARRKNDLYMSNLDYGGQYVPLDFKLLDCGMNTYDNFINNNINYYEWTLSEFGDIYISDCGIYFPSQYCNQLNNKYPYLSVYQALSRQVSHNNVHINAQNLNRVWDKIREQSDIYINCNKCIYLWGLVIQQITIYDKYESAVNRVKPCKITLPLTATKEMKLQSQLYYDNFCNQHGKVKKKLLIYINRSKHDTYYFEKLLKKGKKKNEKN